MRTPWYLSCTIAICTPAVFGEALAQSPAPPASTPPAVPGAPAQANNPATQPPSPAATPAATPAQPAATAPAPAAAPATPPPPPPPPPPELAQIPSWSPDDLAFFLHGSMGTEVVPEVILRAIIRAYPDLFPTKDLSHLGLIADPAFGWPIGFSRKEAPHLGNLPSLGINCAACHVTELRPTGDGPAMRVLGGSSHFDPEAFFSTLATATYRSADPGNMKRLVAAYLAESDPGQVEKSMPLFEAKWKEQEERIKSLLIANPFGAKDIAPGNLHFIAPGALQFDYARLQAADLTTTVELLVKLFHNTRASLHLPDQPPDRMPPLSGPGRNDVIGVLSATLLGKPVAFAPAKFGFLWNLNERKWFHWDASTSSPLARNVLTALGVGAPLVEGKASFDFAAIKRYTDLSQRILPPKYPFAVDDAAAKRGAELYKANCAHCHDSSVTERLFTPEQVGTSGERVKQFTNAQAQGFNQLLKTLQAPGYEPIQNDPMRATGKLWSPTLEGVWARSPYLHNGSVRTLYELLSPAGERDPQQRRGSRTYVPGQMGYADEGPYVLDATQPGNFNGGHEYGSKLNAEQKRDLIEYLKTL